MSRKLARETVYKLVFASLFDGGAGFDTLLQSAAEEGQLISGEDLDFAKSLLNKVLENKAEIDKTIEDNLVDYTLQRVAKSDLAVLMVAVCELKFCKDTPENVAVNEAVEISKKYSGENGYKFVNGVLSKIVSGAGA
ncbi:MAG: transcription antitermination factor NusB [Firmicutes bacterium]|nr:transcription antitermination factor NusB [Bacillota bacterium]